MGWTAILSSNPGEDPGFEKGFFTMSPSSIRGKTPVWLQRMAKPQKGSGGQRSWCRLYYNDVSSKKAMQYLVNFTLRTAVLYSNGKCERFRLKLTHPPGLSTACNSVKTLTVVFHDVTHLYLPTQGVNRAITDQW